LRGDGNKAMPTGTLKMWNADRGYGFIADDAGGPDMFLHISALQAAGIDPDNAEKGEGSQSRVSDAPSQGVRRCGKEVAGIVANWVTPGCDGHRYRRCRAAKPILLVG